MLRMWGLGGMGGLNGLNGLKKANGPNNKNENKNFVTHLMTMPQAAVKNYKHIM